MFRALLILLLLSGCDFDSQRQEDLMFPATLVVRNLTDQRIAIDTIYSKPQAKSAFTLNGSELGADDSMTLKLSEAAIDDIKAKQFVIAGRCPTNKQWQANGSDLKQESVENADEWSVTVSIERC